MSTCASCGEELRGGRFCPACGASVDPAPGDAPTAEQPASPPGPPPAAGPPSGPGSPPPGPAAAAGGGTGSPTGVVPAAAAAPPPTEGGGAQRTWWIVGIVAVLAVAAGLGWWLGSGGDDEAADGTTTTTSTSTTSTTTTSTTSTTSTSSTSTTTTTAAPARSWDIGLEWVGDGRAPAPGVVDLGGGYIVELGLATSLVRDDQGTWIWLAREIARQEPYAVFQLVDYVPTTGATGSDVFVLGTTACTVGGTPTVGVVAVFTYQDAPELTDPREAWVIAPASASLVDPGGPVVCENEGWGV